MINPIDVNVNQVVWYLPFPWAEMERGLISSFCEDPNYVFVRYTEWCTAARTACSDLYISKLSIIK